MKSNAKRRELMMWFGKLDQTRQKAILRDYSLRMRAAADRCRQQKKRLSDTDRIDELLAAIVAARSIENEHHSTDTDLSKIELEGMERRQRAARERFWVSDNRRYLEKRLKEIVLLHDEKGFSFRIIQEYFEKHCRKKVSLGLLHSIYKGAKAAMHDQDNDKQIQ
jgi:hypothetical protein